MSDLSSAKEYGDFLVTIKSRNLQPLAAEINWTKTDLQNQIDNKSYEKHPLNPTSPEATPRQQSKPYLLRFLQNLLLARLLRWLRRLAMTRNSSESVIANSAKQSHSSMGLLQGFALRNDGDYVIAKNKVTKQSRFCIILQIPLLMPLFIHLQGIIEVTGKILHTLYAELSKYFGAFSSCNPVEFDGFKTSLNLQANIFGFNPIEFDGIKKQTGFNSLILAAKQWIQKTGAIGIISKTDHYGSEVIALHDSQVITEEIATLDTESVEVPENIKGLRA